jgi:methylenetetrahydrofolate dehydrogenase (NADP+)/methenyltetrahydrofolate cyclohydrolase
VERGRGEVNDMTKTTYTLIDGRKISTDIKKEISEQVADCASKQGKKVPHLAIILVGDDGASQTYVDLK